MGLELPAYPTVPQQMPETVSVGSRYLNVLVNSDQGLLESIKRGGVQHFLLDLGTSTNIKDYFHLQV